jgi:hypothetical protein
LDAEIVIFGRFQDDRAAFAEFTLVLLLKLAKLVIRARQAITSRKMKFCYDHPFVHYNGKRAVI